MMEILYWIVGIVIGIPLAIISIGIVGAVWSAIWDFIFGNSYYG